MLGWHCFPTILLSGLGRTLAPGTCIQYEWVPPPQSPAFVYTCTGTHVHAYKINLAIIKKNRATFVSLMMTFVYTNVFVFFLKLYFYPPPPGLLVGESVVLRRWPFQKNTFIVTIKETNKTRKIRRGLWGDVFMMRYFRVQGDQNSFHESCSAGIISKCKDLGVQVAALWLCSFHLFV